jgi:hypothetical protein
MLHERKNSFLKLQESILFLSISLLSELLIKVPKGLDISNFTELKRGRKKSRKNCRKGAIYVAEGADVKVKIGGRNHRFRDFPRGSDSAGEIQVGSKKKKIYEGSKMLLQNGVTIEHKPHKRKVNLTSF